MSAKIIDLASYRASRTTPIKKSTASSRRPISPKAGGVVPTKPRAGRASSARWRFYFL